MSEVSKLATNGDVVERVMEDAKASLAEFLAGIREHPDEMAVAAAPLLFALAISFKYRLGFIEHELLCAMAGGFSPVAVAAYRQWKGRPAGRVLRKAV